MWALAAPGALQARGGCGGARLRPRGARQLYGCGDRGLLCDVPAAAGGGRAEEEGQVPSDMESLSSFWKPVSGTL